MRQRVLRSARAMAGNPRLPAWQRRAESTELVREAPRNASPREPHRIKPDKGGGNQFRAWTQKKRGRTSALVGSDWAVAMTMPAAAPAARTQIILEVVAVTTDLGARLLKLLPGWAGPHATLSPVFHLRCRDPRIFTLPGLAPLKRVFARPYPGSPFKWRGRALRIGMPATSAGMTISLRVQRRSRVARLPLLAPENIEPCNDDDCRATECEGIRDIAEH